MSESGHCVRADRMFRPGKDQKILDVWNGRKSVFLSDLTAKYPVFHRWHAVVRLVIITELLYVVKMMVNDEIFDDISESRPLVRLARKYIWWTDPVEIITNNLPRLVASVMELGTWEDAEELRELLTR